MASLLTVTYTQMRSSGTEMAASLDDGTLALSLDTEKRAIETTEYHNDLPNIDWITVEQFGGDEYFYAEYISKNDDQKGFNYLKRNADGDAWNKDQQFGKHVNETQVHIRIHEDYNNILYLNLFFDSIRFFWGSAEDSNEI